MKIEPQMLIVGKATRHNKGGTGEFIAVEWLVSDFDELILYAYPPIEPAADAVKEGE